MWKILRKEVDLGEPTSFLDHVCLDCTQRECETSKDVVDNFRNMFESRISAGAKEKLLFSGRHDANISAWSRDMEGHAKKCVEIYSELANKTTEKWIIESRDAMHGLSSIWRRRKWISWRLIHCLLTNCSKMSIFGSYWCRPVFLRYVNKFACALMKWSKACDKRLARLISYIHHTCKFWAILFCGTHSTTMQIRIVSRLWFCRRPWRFQVNISWNSVHFRKPNINANKLDVQETDFSFHTVLQKLKSFLSMQVYAWMGFLLSICGI